MKLSLRKDIIQQIQTNAIVKIVPSSIKDAGVGVITLTAIKQGTVVFKPERNHFIQWEEVSGISDKTKQHIESVCNNNEFGFWLDRSINDIGAAYFVNHSDTPNLIHYITNDIYVALKDIQIGEELTCKYQKGEIDW
jgi:SET domain-containing protein